VRLDRFMGPLEVLGWTDWVCDPTG